MNWLTFVIILLFAFCFWLGMKKGLIKMVYSIGILIAGFVLTIVLSPVVSSFLHHNDSIYQFVYQAVEENISLEGKGKTLRQENLMIDNLPLPEMLRQKLKENNNAEVYQAMAVTSFKTYIYKYVTNMILNGISYFSVYLCITDNLHFLASACLGYQTSCFKGIKSIGRWYYRTCSGTFDVLAFLYNTCDFF